MRVLRLFQLLLALAGSIVTGHQCDQGHQWGFGQGQHRDHHREPQGRSAATATGNQVSRSGSIQLDRQFARIACGTVFKPISQFVTVRWLQVQGGLESRRAERFQWQYLQAMGRSLAIGLIGFLVCASWAIVPRPSLADELPLEARVQAARSLFDQAFEATNGGQFAQAERYWTQILELFPDNAEIWSNRGNARASQNRLQEAISDYNEAISRAPNAPDPYLNRGAARENAGDLTGAIADYDHVLELDPNDAAAYNNRGNAEAGLGQWAIAVEDYAQAERLAPDFAIARVNHALALFQVGDRAEALRLLRNLVRKYPTFADARAALTAALWDAGDRGEAESQWVSVVGLDRRYKDLEWVAKVRRWPPAMVAALEKFLKL